MQERELIVGMTAALAVGLLIGIERGWSGKDEEEGDRVAGIRTFSLIGLLGGVWSILSIQMGETWLLGLGFLAVIVMAVAGYVVESIHGPDIGTTTAYTQMLTFALGAWAASGYPVFAVATTVVVITLLGLKPMLHQWIRSIETVEIYAGIKLLIISVVMLPLLPNQGYGPWEAINPHWIWWMVVLISGISFVGYFAMKQFGDRIGIMVTALIGGLASSTAVTLNMANLSREKGPWMIFMAGVMAASSIMFIRIIVEVSIVNADLLPKLLPPLLVMFFGVIGGAVWLWKSRRRESEGDPDLKLTNPLKVTTALKFGLFLGLILFLSTVTEELFGDQGIYYLAVFSGLMDVDAITLSLSRLSQDGLSHETAVFGIMLGAVTNTLVKGLMFAWFVGLRSSMRLLMLMLSAGGLGLLTALFTIG
ncbi:MAG: MgtC/SapB family protein [Bacteroidota bacterium]